jgi:hypothetical protein
MAEMQEECTQCDAKVGERHEMFCGRAKCKATGIQQIQCEGELHEYNGREYGEHEGPCLPSIFNGYYNGELEAMEYGWYTSPGSIWGVTEDLNRVHAECRWDSELERFVKRD